LLPSAERELLASEQVIILRAIGSVIDAVLKFQDCIFVILALGSNQPQAKVRFR
jgi:hypothetical protein